MDGERPELVLTDSSPCGGESWHLPVLFLDLTFDGAQPSLLREAQRVLDGSSREQISHIVINGCDPFVGFEDASRLESLEAEKVEGIEYHCRCLAVLSH